MAAEIITDPLLLSDEEWRPIPGYEGYYSISSLARVRSEVTVTGRRRVRLMSPSVNSAGRGYVTVRLTLRGDRRSYLVHRLVAATFLDSANATLQINHRDGNTRNNLPSNLEYVTPAQNSRHARAILKTGQWKLTEDSVRAIRARARRGELHCAIATDFRLATSTVTRIINRLSWAHVD